MNAAAHVPVRDAAFWAARIAPFVAFAIAALAGASWWMAGYPPPPGGGPPGYGGPPPPGVPPPYPYGAPPPPRPPHPPVRPPRSGGCDCDACDADTCTTLGECIICDLECLSGCGTSSSAAFRATLAQRAPGILVILAPIFILAAWRRRLVPREQVIHASTCGNDGHRRSA